MSQNLGGTPQKSWGQKRAKFGAISDNFRLRSWIYTETIKLLTIGKLLDRQRSLPRWRNKFGELWSTNNKAREVDSEPPKTNLLLRKPIIISPPMGVAASNIYMVDNDQGFLTHTSPWTESPIMNENSKIAPTFTMCPPITKTGRSNITKLFQVTCRMAGMRIWVQLFFLGGAHLKNCAGQKPSKIRRDFWQLRLRSRISPELIQISS